MAAPAPSRAADAPARSTDRTLGLRWRSPGRAWPLWILTVGMPGLYLLGLQGLAWAVPGLVLGFGVLGSRARFPLRVAWLVLFCGWVLLGAALLRPAEYPLFLFRWLLFAGALASLVWIVNESEERLSTDRLVSWLATLWIVMVVFGYLALAAPGFDTRSPFQLLAGSIGRIQFVDDISRWRLAQFQTGQDVRLPRPSAPFAFTNGWGAGLALLTPFFIRSWLVGVARSRRRVGLLLLVACVAPVLISGNRGVWISVTGALVYWVARRAVQRDLRPLAALAAMAVVVAIIFVATPAGQLVTDRLDTSERSTEGRASIYEGAWQGALDSPLLGNGKPGAVENSSLPPIGTHGLLWYLLYVHGFVGLGLFTAWLGSEVVRSGHRIRSQGAWWAHLSLVIALIQMPYYGMQPQVVLIGVAAGVAYRERARYAAASHGAPSVIPALR
ncbi:MAG: hypothetical protein JWM47_2741 [Acidimicrobiales bacterium]|nr:hypothetical protein [Acidimicrobiales bacterium]